MSMVCCSGWRVTSGLTSTNEKPRARTSSTMASRGASDRVAIVPIAFIELHVLAQRFAVQSAQLRIEGDLGDPVALALMQREGQEERGPIGRQFRHGLADLDVGVAVLQVEPAQQFLVEVDAGRIVFVRRREEPPPGVLARIDHLVEAALAEGMVADKRDVADERARPVGDLVDHVDAVLALADDLRRDHRGEAPALGVGVEDALPIGLRRARGEDGAGLQLHHVLQLVVAQQLVALEGDAVDQRVFHQATTSKSPCRVRLTSWNSPSRTASSGCGRCGRDRTDRRGGPACRTGWCRFRCAGCPRFGSTGWCRGRRSASPGRGARRPGGGRPRRGRPGGWSRARPAGGNCGTGVGRGGTCTVGSGPRSGARRFGGSFGWAALGGGGTDLQRKRQQREGQQRGADAKQQATPP